MTSFQQDLRIARTIAMEAAALVRQFQGKLLTVDRKLGDEPVTEADRAASDLIVRRLREAFPGDAVLSEEVPDDGSRLKNSRVWMVDPIDGTRDFIRGETGYAVMIGLCVEGRPQVGVVAQPATGRVYGGIPGGEAWVEEASGERQPLRTSPIAGPPGIRLVASKSHRNERIDAVKRLLSIEDELNVGGVGLKVGLVAEGVRDLYVYPGSQTKLWDSCAPEAILLAAGGRITDVEGQLLSYTGEELNNKNGIVASNGPLHDFAVAALRPLAATTPSS